MKQTVTWKTDQPSLNPEKDSSFQQGRATFSTYAQLQSKHQLKCYMFRFKTIDTLRHVFTEQAPANMLFDPIQNNRYFCIYFTSLPSFTMQIENASPTPRIFLQAHHNQIENDIQMIQSIRFNDDEQKLSNQTTITRHYLFISVSNQNKWTSLYYIETE